MTRKCLSFDFGSAPGGSAALGAYARTLLLRGISILLVDLPEGPRNTVCASRLRPGRVRGAGREGPQADGEQAQRNKPGVVVQRFFQVGRLALTSAHVIG